MKKTALQEFEDIIPQPTISKECEKKLPVLHRAMEYMLQGLVNSQDEGFVDSTSGWGREYMFRFVAFHLCETPQSKSSFRLLTMNFGKTVMH